MLPFDIRTKKEQAMTLCQKYFHSYDTFYNNKEKGTSNKFLREIFSFVWCFLQQSTKSKRQEISPGNDLVRMTPFIMKTKNEEAINLLQK